MYFCMTKIVKTAVNVSSRDTFSLSVIGYIIMGPHRLLDEIYVAE